MNKEEFVNARKTTLRMLIGCLQNCDNANETVLRVATEELKKIYDNENKREG